MMMNPSDVIPILPSPSPRVPPFSTRWFIRIPLKVLVFAGVLVVTLFPYPSMLLRQWDRIRNMDQMITPDAPELAIYEALIRARLQRERDVESLTQASRLHTVVDITPQTIRDMFPNGIPSTLPAPVSQLDSKAKAADTLDPGVDADAPSTAPADSLIHLPIQFAGDLTDIHPQRIQQLVERMIYQEVPYDWDWNVWGVADYMPSVAEIFERAREYSDGRPREDCDGRAVLAASIMRRLGFQARLVTDLRHVWVETPAGQFMGPGRAITMTSTPGGTATAWATLMLNAPVALSFGIAVFPFVRELVILIALFLLLLAPGTNWRTAMFGGMLLLQGLLFMRVGHVSAMDGSGLRHEWPAWVGLLHVLAGVVLLIWHGRRARKKTGVAPSPSAA